MINGSTTLIAHMGFPTFSFKSPSIYNPWFEKNGVDAVVVPMGIQAEHFPAFFRTAFTLTNLRGALITMPHKLTTMDLVDEVSPVARIAGATNAVVRRPDGSLLADQFDGEGFVRGIRRKGFHLTGKRALVIGNGGVGSPIAASLAQAGIEEIGLFDPDTRASEALAGRIAEHFPGVTVETRRQSPEGYDLVVNASPLGMRQDDPLPVDVTRIAPGTWVGDVVLSPAVTPLLLAARARGCTIQAGADMLFEMVPAMLAFFDLGSASPDELRREAQIPEADGA
jgi:shikimate dehydrogenase